MKYLLAIAGREARIRLSNPVLPLWDVLAPLIYLVIFGASLDQWMPPPPGMVNYSSFFLGGVVGMVTFTIDWNSSYAFFEDLQSGIFHELLTYPFPRRDLLLGKLLFTEGFALLASLLCCLAGIFVLHVAIPAAAWPGLFFWIITGMAGWYFLYTWMALKLRGFNAYHTTTSGLFLVLMFISNLFYPADKLPAWIQWLARINPVTWQIDLLRAALFAAPYTRQLWLEAAGFLAFLALSFFFANRSLNGPME
jgi:ABC-2 type transport system permease protein